METSMASNKANHRTSCCSLPDDTDSSFPLISLSPIRLPKNHRFQSGYDCEFVSPPPQLVQTVCAICLLIYRHPQLVSCCGHNFCKDCIAQIMEANRPCPLCQESGFTVLHNQDLDRCLAQLEVYCVHSKLGCEWTGELGQYDKHLNVNPEEDQQLAGCKYVELECAYKCGSWFHRGAIARHQTEKCPQRPSCCDYCKEYTSIHADVIYRHWPVCKRYPLSCPNNCTAYAIERQNMEEHLQLECPLKLIECEFSCAGCEELVAREDMSTHLEECHVQHSSMLAVANQKLMDELAEKTEQMSQMKKDSQEELAAVKRESQRQIDNLWVENAILKQQVTQVKEEMEELKKQLSSLSGIYKTAQAQTVEQQLKHVRTLSSELSDLKANFTESKASLRQQSYSIQASVGVFPLEFVMPNCSHYFKTKEEWRSAPFYSHLQGYRLCLVVYPGETENSHLAVHASLLQGEYDDRLKWPFHAEITVQLRNMLMDRHHATSVIRFTHMTPDKYTSRVGGKAEEHAQRMCEGWGLKRFILHSELSYNMIKNRQYLKDDQLCFRIIKVSLSN